MKKTKSNKRVRTITFVNKSKITTVGHSDSNLVGAVSFIDLGNDPMDEEDLKRMFEWLSEPHSVPLIAVGKFGFVPFPNQFPDND